MHQVLPRPCLSRGAQKQGTSSTTKLPGLRNQDHPASPRTPKTKLLALLSTNEDGGCS